MIIIGANVSSAGGPIKAIDRGKALGVEAMQFFASSPRSWKRRVISPDDASQFRETFKAAGYLLCGFMAHT